MDLKFNIDYKTRYGEELFMNNMNETLSRMVLVYYERRF